MRSWFTTVEALLVATGRVLWRHWPQLLGIHLLGAAARSGFLWLAFLASKVSATLGLFILPLAPLSVLVALVFMMRVCIASLPALQGEQVGNRRARVGRDLMLAASVMLPFLTVYGMQGLLLEDSRTYVHDVTLDEYLHTVVMSDDRLSYASGWLLLAMIAGALVVRRVIAITRAARRFVVMAAVAAYLEALWMVSLAKAMSTELTKLFGWIRRRAVVDALLRQWDLFVSWLGPVGELAVVVLGWVSGFVGSATLLLLLPVAWLALGAHVCQDQLDDAELSTPSMEEIQRRIGAGVRARTPVSSWVEKVVVQLLDPLIDPIDEAWTGLRRVFSAGAVPMTIFCLAFVGLNQLQPAVARAVHLLMGPRDVLLAASVEPYLVLVVRTVYFVVTIAVLAAAVNCVVLAYPTRPRRALRGSVENSGTAAGATTAGTPPAAPQRGVRS
ncbi:hypothetical protein EII34_13640 [Arachnia propionica]|uniref:Uncharacterized protein n=1 Tax=Arachnia propionica TaxID=1750 RepID=A0A3P1T2N3_9ACTN|nr:hypothetical protein [Arachnia propionica]RRD03624.1 hypothetical protein EII34_13640 [Arachnia propionica]